MSDAASPLSPEPLPSDEKPSSVVPNTAPPSSPAQGTQWRLRLWPAVVIIILQWLVMKIPGWVQPASLWMFFGLLAGSLLGAVGIAAWWLFASRIRWKTRLWVLVSCLAMGVASYAASHKSISVIGYLLYFLPVLTTAAVVWLVLTPFLRGSIRWAGLMVVFLAAWGYPILVRMDGIDGNFAAEMHYRWEATPEEKLLQEFAARPNHAKTLPTSEASSTPALGPGDWPAFRGPNRDNVLKGVRLAMNWKEHPPKQLWRHRIGPGWCSFAVVGNRIFTQEQRGKDELVVCYQADSGEELWTHGDENRFEELMSGAGPRATPAFHEGRLYALGGKGRLNCLDPETGKVIWEHDIVADSGAKVPMWGFSASPLVVHGIVTVFAGGNDGKAVLGYDAVTGKLAWSAGTAINSYCSLHPARLDNVEQLIISTDVGLTAFEPATGRIIWEYSAPEPSVVRCIQPTVLGNSELLLGTGLTKGAEKVRVRHDGDNWTREKVWSTNAISPYFNDVVVQRGQLYGFDAMFFTCINLEDGKRKWRERGYANGQVLLLADQELLLILTEKGDVALVDASPDGCKERARFHAIDGKTWNHPVLVRGKLFVRNGEEAACYQLDELGGPLAQH